MFALYSERREPKTLQKIASWWVFPLEKQVGIYLPLILASIASMFLELLLIRWISSEIRIFSFYKNFALIACFLGFGLGCFLCTKKVNLLPLLISPFILALTITIPWEPLRQMVLSLPNLLGAYSEVHIWGVPSIPGDWTSMGKLTGLTLLIVPTFMLLVFTFIPLGQIIGWYLQHTPNGILGYTTNVIASLAGILFFTLLCLWSQPPLIWFVVAGLVLAGLFWKIPRLRWSILIAFPLCGWLSSFNPQGAASLYWSPYQKLSLTPIIESGHAVSYQLLTNDSWYQQIVNLSDRFVKEHPQLFQTTPIEQNSYNIPYRFCPHPDSVLILGAGMGNDVAAALRNGGREVVAVEIDPLILKLGKKLHFEKPYDSPRVLTVVDDARSYIQNCKRHFDLICFSLLDSHTTSSHYSNIRIDNYVYTIEALQAAQKLLKPEGVFIVKFQVDTPWIAGRLRELMIRTFGQEPLVFGGAYQEYSTSGRFFVAGSPVKIGQALSDLPFKEFVERHSGLKTQPATITTDDWPYFYQHEPGLPASVLAISLVLLLVCIGSFAQLGCSFKSIPWHFFFLGSGFMLLEVQVVSKMALLFGTTWMVNSLVIAGLLILIVAANMVAFFFPRFPRWVAFMGLLISLLLSYAIPLEKFFYYESTLARGILATIVLCLPAFFAGIIFIRSFTLKGFSGNALGANLLGSLFGGFFESISMWTGLNSLLFLMALMYLAAFLSMGSFEKKRQG
jgi:SAM-dependent methyltransferase